MSLFVCSVCGHVEFKTAPKKCPTCGAAQKAFHQNDKLFEDAMKKSQEGAIKHIPSLKINKECGLIPEQGCIDIIVRIGDILHPMEEKHFIQWMDCYVDQKYVGRKMLTPGLWAAGCFHAKASSGKVTVVENCNIHGHWMMERNI